MTMNEIQLLDDLLACEDAGFTPWEINWMDRLVKHPRCLSVRECAILHRLARKTGLEAQRQRNNNMMTTVPDCVVEKHARWLLPLLDDLERLLDNGVTDYSKRMILEKSGCLLEVVMRIKVDPTCEK